MVLFIWHTLFYIIQPFVNSLLTPAVGHHVALQMQAMGVNGWLQVSLAGTCLEVAPVPILS